MRGGLISLCAAAALLAASAPVSALELREAEAAHAAITLPDGWALSTDGAWSLADAPDHLAHVRVTSFGRALQGDAAGESYLTDVVAQTWSTYTIDRHVHRVTCGRFTGVELFGHGAGDGWDRARFHVLLLVDPQTVTTPTPHGVVVLLTSRADVWDTVHPPLERAVHALHSPSA